MTAFAQDVPAEEEEEPVLGNTLQFSVAVPFELYVLYERRVLALGNWELSSGTTFQYSFQQEEPIRFIQQNTLCKYEVTWATCLEVNIPLIGEGSWVRLLTTLRF